MEVPSKAALGKAVGSACVPSLSALPCLAQRRQQTVDWPSPSTDAAAAIWSNDLSAAPGP